MEHLNYCRQMTRQFSEAMRKPGFHESNKAILSQFIDLAAMSMKFLLPDGGMILDDPELRAIDESSPLRLPHPFIAIEYSRKRWVAHPVDDGRQPSKGLLFAREREGGIALSVCVWNDELAMWGPTPEAFIPETGYLDRSFLLRGRVPVRILTNGIIPASDYMDEVATLFDLLNALACSNVVSTKSIPKKHGKKCKTALPFDVYHVLEITTASGATSSLGGSHRSPREHLRRGHIRRLSDGRRVWVNATVVAAGRGAGVVRKDYMMRHGNNAT